MSYTANNTSTVYALRDDYIADNPVETFIYMESNTDIDSTNSVPYSIMVRLPSTKYTDFNSPLSTPDRLTITAAGRVVKPTSTLYTKHIEIKVVDNIVSTY